MPNNINSIQFQVQWHWQKGDKRYCYSTTLKIQWRNNYTLTKQLWESSGLQGRNSVTVCGHIGNGRKQSSSPHLLSQSNLEPQGCTQEDFFLQRKECMVLQNCSSLPWQPETLATYDLCSLYHAETSWQSFPESRLHYSPIEKASMISPQQPNFIYQGTREQTN
jgi:hypothetical protein